MSDPAVGGKFSTAYAELHRFVRRPGIESDMRLLTPMEFHASSTELVQILEKGHYGVQLDPESWSRLVTWIDLNAPFHGSWHEIVGAEKAEPLAAPSARNAPPVYGHAGAVPRTPRLPPYSAAPRLCSRHPRLPETSDAAIADWPWSVDEARRRQQSLGTWERTIDVGDGVELSLVRVPGGPLRHGVDRRDVGRTAGNGGRGRASLLDRPLRSHQRAISSVQAGA